MIEFVVAGVVAFLVTAFVSVIVALIYWLGWYGAAIDLFLMLWVFFWRVFE